jgi:hypothetical protein
MKMSEIIKKTESENDWIRDSKTPSEDTIKSKVIVRFNEVQLTNSLITELKQTIQFKGKQYSMLEYYFLRKGKRIWIQHDWDSDGDGYLYCEFYCDSFMSTEEIKDLTNMNEYTGIDNLFGNCLIHVYYQNTNNKKGYFQMWNGGIRVGYSFDDFQSVNREKLKEDIEHIINLSDTHDSNKPFNYNKSVRTHTISFEEVDNEFNLSGNVSTNREFTMRSKDWNSDWKLEGLKMNNINFNKSKNNYVFWVQSSDFKKTLLRDSFNYIKMYLPSQIESDYPKPSHI